MPPGTRVHPLAALAGNCSQEASTITEPDTVIPADG